MKVDAKRRYTPEGDSTEAFDVFVDAVFIGIVCRVETREWLAIPPGTKVLAEWAGVERLDRKIDAVAALIARDVACRSDAMRGAAR